LSEKGESIHNSNFSEPCKVRVEREKWMDHSETKEADQITKIHLMLWTNLVHTNKMASPRPVWQATLRSDREGGYDTIWKRLTNIMILRKLFPILSIQTIIQSGVESLFPNGSIQVGSGSRSGSVHSSTNLLSQSSTFLCFFSPHFFFYIKSMFISFARRRHEQFDPMNKWLSDGDGRCWNQHQEQTLYGVQNSESMGHQELLCPNASMTCHMSKTE